MASTTNIAEEILDALSFLYVLDDIEAFTRTLGYDLSPIADQLVAVEHAARNVVTKVTDLDEAVEALISLEDPTGSDASEATLYFAQALASAVEAFKAIRTLANSFRGEGFDAFLSEVVGGGSPDDFAREFYKRAEGALIVYYLRRNRPAVGDFLHTIGVLESEDIPANAAQHRVAFTEHRVRWERISEFLKDPTGAVKDLYDWGANPNRIPLLLDRLARLLLSRMISASVVRLPASNLAPFENILPGSFPTDVDDTDALRGLLWKDLVSGLQVEIQTLSLPATDSTPPALGFAAIATLDGSFEFSLSENLLLSIDGGTRLTSGLYLAFIPGQQPTFSLA